jgi:hypothetical protein
MEDTIKDVKIPEFGFLRSIHIPVKAEVVNAAAAVVVGVKRL